MNNLDEIHKHFEGSGLQFHAIPYGQPEWYAFRSRGIGGSEVGIITGHNPYAKAIKLYYQKLGIHPPNETSEHMWHGRMLEPYIKMCWKHYDGIPGNYMKNYEEGKVIRKSFKFDGYIVNPKYPWIFVSPDSFIQAGGINMLNFEPLKKHGVLELKLLSYWGEHAWEDGFPIYYILQVQTYLMVCELDYAEICIFHEGNRIEVHGMWANKEIQDRIVRATRHWYENHLKPGLEAKNSFDMAVKLRKKTLQLQYHSMIQSYEPEPDDSLQYKSFQSGMFSRDRESVKAPPGTDQFAFKAHLLTKIIAELDTRRTAFRNKVVQVHKIEEAEYIDYDSQSYSRFYVKKGSKDHTLDIRITDWPEEDRIKAEADKIDLSV